MAEDPRWRLFVALALPGAVRKELARWGASAVGKRPELRLLPDESLHVTLCFLGAMAAPAAEEILTALEVARGGARPDLALGEPLWLPRRGPRVLAVAVLDAGGRLADVQDRISGALQAGGWYRPEERPFLAHVTVGRVRHDARVRAVELPAPVPLTFAGERVALMRSRLGPRGARYEELGGLALG